MGNFDTKSKVIMGVVILVTLLLIVFGIINFLKSDEEDVTIKEEEKGLENELSEEYKKMVEEKEKEEINNNENDEEINEIEEEQIQVDKEDISKEEMNNKKKLASILGIKESTLITKTEMNNKVAEWYNDGFRNEEETIEQMIEKEFGDNGKIQDELNLYVTEELSEFDLNQLALRFPEELLEGKEIHPKLRPQVFLESSLYGGISKSRGQVYGWESLGKGYPLPEDTNNKRYLDENEGFIKSKRKLNVGYISLDYINDEFVLNYKIKIDGEVTEKELEDFIKERDVKGKTGIGTFQEYKSKNTLYVGDSILDVEIPVKMEDIFGKKKTKENMKKWREGKLKPTLFYLGDTRVKLREVSVEEYEKGKFLD